MDVSLWMYSEAACNYDASAADDDGSCYIWDNCEEFCFTKTLMASQMEQGFHLIILQHGQELMLVSSWWWTVIVQEGQDVVTSLPVQTSGVFDII